MRNQQNYHARSFIKKMSNKKSQFHITETVVILSVFMIFALIIFSSYYRFFVGDYESQQEKSFDLESVKAAHSLPFLADLQCSSNGILEANCVDYFKLNAAIQLMNESRHREHYFERFGFGSIIIEEIYPESKKIVLYNQPLGNYAYKDATSRPISIFYPIEGRYGFGIMILERLK